ncbi:MAG: sorbosone dehydrogenase family protein, partial [Gemmatimonadetes bacterium]|nr:sorbosone dehydrogenase family protein [Gemmatimonadota bacterium]
MWNPLTASRSRALASAFALAACLLVGASGCATADRSSDANADRSTAPDRSTAADRSAGDRAELRPGYGPDPVLPPPDTTHRVSRFARVVGWPAGQTPQAPEGFAVSLFAEGLQHPRWLYVLPNGDVLVSESNNPGSARDSTLPAANLAARYAAGMRGPSANRITLLRDADSDGTPETRETFLSGLNRPFGMALAGDYLYVGNTDALVRYRYGAGETRIDAPGEKVLDLPAGGYNNHWTRNVLANRDGSKLYVTVGSATNVDVEGIDAKDPRRAAILEVNPDGSGMRVFASGLRNPNGLAWAPGSSTLWTAVNERDGLGEDLVPDFVTSVKEGAFYGWPYAYFGSHEEPRQAGKRPDLVARAVAPDFALGAHTATMSIVFGQGPTFPERYREGAFIAQHGSWNRSGFAGYRVLFLPFRGGKPVGPAEDFLTGFLTEGAGEEVHGRPVGLAFLRDGSLLVADDAGDRVWRIQA